MFGLFGNKSRSRIDSQLIPELKSYVVQVKDATGVSYLAIVEPMLSFALSLRAHGKGLSGFAQAINGLSRQLEEEIKTLGSIGSSLLEITIPEQTKEQYDLLVDKIGDFAAASVQKGYSYDDVGVAMGKVSSEIAKVIDKDNLLNIALMRKVLLATKKQYRREQFRKTADGEDCSDESIETLLRAEASGYELTIASDRTFVLKQGSTAHYLRSSSDIKLFQKFLEDQTETTDSQRDPIEKLVEQGQAYLRKQDLQKAISSFSAALRISPDSRDLYFWRGVSWSNSYHNRGQDPDDLQKAINDYTSAVQIDREFAEGYFQRAGLLSAQGQIAAAIEDYGMAIDRNHKASSAYYCRGLLWQRLGMSEKKKAIADFTGAIRTGGRDDQFMALMARADAHYSSDEFELALDDLNAADAYYPKAPPGLYEKRAAILVKLGRVTEAIIDFGKGIAACSSLASREFVASMHEQRGECYLQIGKTTPAESDFKAAAKLRSEK